MWDRARRQSCELTRTRWSTTRGPAYQSGRSAAELAVLPLLRHGDVRRIDLMMVSHGDQDHSGGLSEVLAANAGPSRCYRTGAFRRRLMSAIESHLIGLRAQRGQQWQWDDVTFTVLHPDDLPENGQFAESANDGSCVHVDSRPRWLGIVDRRHRGRRRTSAAGAWLATRRRWSSRLITAVTLRRVRYSSPPCDRM